MSRRKKLILLRISLVLLLICSAIGIQSLLQPQRVKRPFIAAIDTMKVSRDTQRYWLPPQEIKSIVALSASLNTNYITVDTDWDYPDYMAQWIGAIRATKRHIWFRIHPAKWEDDENVRGIMSPQDLVKSERTFILQHASFFRSGDIFDPCPEAENGKYWLAHYGAHWTDHAPNNATRAFNAFLRDTTDTANSAFKQKHISGVITTIRSTNPFFPTHPAVLEKATVAKFGYITVDSYPEEETTNPAQAVRARLKEMRAIENLWHVPIILGEMGYSNEIKVNDNTQRAVLHAELTALASLPYLAGVNYWVGAGTNASGGFTHIFNRAGVKWSFRPGAYELAAFYKRQLLRH